jgi:hypothetical protein
VIGVIVVLIGIALLVVGHPFIGVLAVLLGALLAIRGV